ncbi:hypothetical protein ACFOHK_10025 [Falsigemmobacter intermedius]|uniref:Uncharacterized protein n=1 Tax=Falsigemmobacter intermedius TaxID=1553448 RepID=A0A3S3YDR9_9RHOB|nr:hypothetical protein [Falsigemmobacter intermedius]RWY41728.1 hypothetical protein EP867_08310 [Falsigemmobacter intermedius]
MEWLIWTGAAMTVAGLIGIFWCIRRVIGAKRAGLPQHELNAVVQRVVAVNLAAFAVSALGLGAVVAGLVLK